jgi:ABC-type antimicrobial peptide transport system permease subunit
VTQRTQEIGVRVAIGASRWDVAWLFLRRGLGQIGLALAVGMPAALALGMLAQIPLVAIEPNDPLTMVLIVMVISIVALTACLMPVRKATRVDPISALRSE